jgi:uncharacterized protein (DUF433 family)
MEIEFEFRCERVLAGGELLHSALLDNGIVELKDRITIDPKVLVGKPVITGTRISVEFIVDLLASGWNHKQILASYPHISEEDILACLQYAGELLHSERVYPLANV